MEQLSESISEELWFGEDDPAFADRAASQSLSASVAKITGLRPMPVVAQKVLTALAEPQWSATAIADMMEVDPSVAAMVLRLANSSFYSRGAPTTSVRHAVTRLGGSKLRELVVGAAAMSVIRGRSPLAKAWRDHCAGTAAVARQLAAGRAGADPSVAFLSGLLHDMGKLLLLETDEVDYSAMAEAQTPCDEDLPAAERWECDFDHAVLGGHVMRIWGIPDPIPQIVAWHHQPVRAYAADRFTADHVAIVRLADRIAEQLDATAELDVDALATSAECAWLGIDADALDGMRNPLATARSEALSVFVG